jgi:hypothetical protein
VTGKIELGVHDRLLSQVGVGSDAMLPRRNIRPVHAHRPLAGLKRSEIACTGVTFGAIILAKRLLPFL